MKHLFSTLTLILALAYSTTACVGEFSYTVQDNVVTFHGSSDTPGVTYHWNFGDQSDANGENVYHVYDTYPEHYNVCLTISDGLGCTDEYCVNIFVEDGPGTNCEGSFTYTVSGSTVAFTGSSSYNEVSYYWFFGDGSSPATGQSQTHTYDNLTETYEVCMIIVNGNVGCQDTICQPVHIEGTTSNDCEASFTYTVSGNTVAFSGSSTEPNVDYHWIFGDGSDANGQNTTHTYTQSPEHYNVCLVIHNTPIGCIDTVCQNIFVEGVENDCEASFTYTVNGNHVTFVGSSSEPGVHYYWLFGDGTSSDDGQTITHTYTVFPEHYNACLVIVNSATGCQDTVCQNIFVQTGTNDCEASFSYTVTGTEVHFHGESNVPGVTYTWSFGDGTSGTGQNPVHNYTLAPEHYTVCLTITNTSGCSDEVCETVFVESTTNNDCDASFTYTISGTEVHFHGMSNVPGVYYNWSFGDGTSGGGENPVHNYTQAPEHYTVCLTIYNGNGCENTQCETIFIEGNGNNSDCEGSFTYTMDGNVVAFHGISTVPGVYYHWSFDDGSDGSGENVTHTFDNYPEHYTVCLTVYNGSGCENTYCQTIFVQSSGGSGSECEASFTYEINNNSVHFFGNSNQDNVDYGWSFGDGSTGTGNDPHHTYTQFPEHYNVCLYIWNNNTGCHDTVCQTVYVQNGGTTECNAEFTYTITGNEVHFNGPSNPDGTHYQWSFGDGTSSDGHNPNHAYTLFPEHYEVCLTVTNTTTGCNETTCQTIFIQQGNSQDHYELSGTIYTGQNFADEGYAMLIHYDASTGMLVLDQTIGIGANGHYSFLAVPGNYFVKAALSPGSSVYANFLPTYFEHELFWYNADVISHTVAGSFNRNIHMIEGNNPGGPGFIGGLVSEGANKTSGPGDPVEGVQVMLLSMNDEPLQYTYSNAFGEFSFSNVAYGTYQVYGEVYNLTTIPAIITIDGTTPTINNIGLLVTSREVTTGVNEVSVINETSVGQVFPNPFKGDAAINISLQNDARLSIRMVDIAGRQVYVDIMNVGSGVQQINLPVSGLSAGIYNLILSDEKTNSTVTRKLVKTE